MPCYAVIDTNVIVSALLSPHGDSATAQVLGLMTDGAFTPLYSDEIMAEYDDVLYREKFNFKEEAISSVLRYIRRLGQHVSPKPADEKTTDPKDQPFYEVVASEKDKEAYLVTGNKRHFPVQPRIVTAREFIDILYDR